MQVGVLNHHISSPVLRWLVPCATQESCLANLDEGRRDDLRGRTRDLREELRTAIADLSETVDVFEV